MSFLPCEESLNRKAFYRSYNKNVPKNLVDELEEEDVPMIGHVQVFLRIKPNGHDSNCELSSTLQIKDERTLVTLAPKESCTYKSLKHSADTTNAYKFSKIFAPSTSQKNVFSGVVAPFVEDFVNGTDCLLFAYGPSSAGKTFTMQGSPKHPGLIPRTLDVLFNTMKGYINKEIKYKPMRHDNIIILTDHAIEMEHKKKEIILNWNPKSIQESSRYIKSMLPENTTFSMDSSDKESSSFDYMSSCSDISKFLSESRLRDKDTVTLLEKGMKYTVWVSFAEVYNETVYDLLEYLPGKAPPYIKRNKLKLVNDSNGNTFISDLKEVCVMSEDEAYHVMLFGKCNLQFATTKLNHKSSRSHCIFTIKLVQVPDVPNPKHARINMFTFCDLAGSERVDKSGNVGERLKETGNINTSLLVLGRCLKALRHNQTSEAKMMVPFRESKLTRIFQNSLTGTDNVAMIVNINQSPSLFDETTHVLKYSAVAQQIILKPPEIIKPPPRRKTRFSVFVGQHKKLNNTIFVDTSGEGCSALGLTTHEKEIYEQEIESLKVKIEDLKVEMRRNEIAVRRELCKKFSEMMLEERKKTTKLLRQTEDDTEEYYIWEIERREEEFQERLKKAKMEANGSGEDQSEIIDSLNSKVESMTREVEDLKNKLGKVHCENEELKIKETEYRCKVEALECNSLSTQELLNTAEVQNKDQTVVDALNQQISKLNDELKEKNSKIKELEELLEEAGSEYIELENLVGVYQEEETKQKATVAEMEMKISELISGQDDCDALLAEWNAKLERKKEQIENLEGVIKVYEEEKRRASVEEKTPDSNAAIETELNAVVVDLKKENASLKENVSDLEIMILDLQNKIEDSSCLAEKYESLLNSESKCKIRNDYLMSENSKLEEEKQKLNDEIIKLNHHSITLTGEVLSLSNENKELKDNIAQSKLENEFQSMSLGPGKMCLACSKVEKNEVSLQCDIINELHKKDIDELKQTLEEVKEKLGNEIVSKQMLEEEKNAEIMHLQTAVKAFLQEKCHVQEDLNNLASEKANLEERIKSVESELKESSKALREVINEKRNDEDQSKVFEGSEKLLAVLKEELEKKGEANQRLLEDNQSLRDVVIEKERELTSFSENHEKQFKNYESMVSKLREDVEMHIREEMRLRSLLQMGTPNKYEKSYLNVSSELTQLKKQLSSELCKECLVKVLPTKKNSSLFDVRGKVSNENMAPNDRRTRRRSKSQPSVSLVDYCEYDDDSDFEIEKKPRGRNARTRVRTFTGMEQNLNESERSDGASEPKTPFSKSRKLLNPNEGGTFLDLKEQVPSLPRTPADVIKRMLRPRRH